MSPVWVVVGGVLAENGKGGEACGLGGAVLDFAVGGEEPGAVGVEKGHPVGAEDAALGGFFAGVVWEVGCFHRATVKTPGVLFVKQKSKLF